MKKLSMSHILIVDDEYRHCESLRACFAHADINSTVASSAEQALEVLKSTSTDAVLLDVRLPGMDGITAISKLRALAPNVPIIVMTAFGTLETAVNARQQNVFEYLIKPFTLRDLKAVVERALVHSPSRPPPAKGRPEQRLIGDSAAMQRVYNLIALAAASDVPVLITGESGTGKELVAKAIHQCGQRRSGRFLPVFLTAIGPTVVESELFGHAKGAFSGAEGSRTGTLELAKGGTIFLDELGDIPLAQQVKLLRAIEESEITRVGEDQPRSIDARFVAATNRQLPELIGRGEFREDLYYRLSVFHIDLPPLRDRKEDIPALADHFVSRLNISVHGIGQDALQALAERDWRGNVRELRNAVEHAAIAARGAEIRASHLPPVSAAVAHDGLDSKLKAVIQDWLRTRLTAQEPATHRADLHNELIRHVETNLIELVMQECRQNQAAASRVLGLDPKTLRAKLGSR